MALAVKTKLQRKIFLRYVLCQSATLSILLLSILAFSKNKNIAGFCAATAAYLFSRRAAAIEREEPLSRGLHLESAFLLPIVGSKAEGALPGEKKSAPSRIILPNDKTQEKEMTGSISDARKRREEEAALLDSTRAGKQPTGSSTRRLPLLAAIGLESGAACEIRTYDGACHVGILQRAALAAPTHAIVGLSLSLQEGGSIFLPWHAIASLSILPKQGDDDPSRAS